MSWAKSDRAKRLPADWWRRRGHVLKHAGYQCQWVRTDTGSRCTEPGSDVDHIKPGDDHSYANLQALCTWHHKQKTAAEAAEARRQAGSRHTRARQQDRHPGALD